MPRTAGCRLPPRPPGSAGLQVAHRSRHAWPPPGLHGPSPASALLRGGPPLPAGSGRATSRGGRWGLCPAHRRTSSLVPYPSPAQRHPPAHRTPHGHEGGGRQAAPGARGWRRLCWHEAIGSDAAAVVRVRSSLSPIHDVMSHACAPQRSPPQLLPAAAYGCLQPAPTSRLRRTSLHLGYSLVLSEHVCDTTPGSGSEVGADARGRRLHAVVELSALRGAPPRPVWLWPSLPAGHPLRPSTSAPDVGDGPGHACSPARGVVKIGDQAVPSSSKIGYLSASCIFFGLSPPTLSSLVACASPTASLHAWDLVQAASARSDADTHAQPGLMVQVGHLLFLPPLRGQLRRPRAGTGA